MAYVTMMYLGVDPSEPGVNMDDLHLGHYVGGAITTASSTILAISQADVRPDYGPDTFAAWGVGFTYDGNSQLSGGTITSLHDWVGLDRIEISNISVSASTGYHWLITDSTQLALSTVLSGADTIAGSDASDLLRGFDGADQIGGGYGSNTIYGGAGDDTISGGGRPNEASGPNYLRGDDGNDVMLGGSRFDDMNGNAGNDTLQGFAGDDWVVGGKGNDVLYGDAADPAQYPAVGNDIVYGNLGDDTCYGGDGADLIRGGQGSDSLSGGAGNDWLSGDLGADMISGGAGADIFHSWGAAGVDRVLDFNAAEGDRVQLDPGTTYVVTQVGADTVIEMTGGAVMTLVGVSKAALPAGWLFLA